jgi:hypothetical protein
LKLIAQIRHMENEITIRERAFSNAVTPRRELTPSDESSFFRAEKSSCALMRQPLRGRRRVVADARSENDRRATSSLAQQPTSPL